ncbi:esterase-like activity of phytase family protein [Methyloligella sp. 2.7D]|uniref:esterase-like activity of phytase family protein n=1 Tax=unclassified Methyloligella TaxID=2625955 RepID=UPI00157CE72B|nr:esterase-like activity of phytase family protein [Methyloligella sp. GL2]QKP76574.1 esterase-like activity of phytase family protein [Methyloligella sp. GL2]
MAAAKPRKRLRWVLLSFFGAALLVAFTAVGLALAAKPWTPLAKPVAIEITALPIDFDTDDPERKEFGKLSFRRGLNLFGSSPHFGGYSALAIDPTGRKIVAISDAGTWLRADLDYDGRFLKGLSNAAIGPLLGKDGKPLSGFSRRDAEALSLADGNIDKGAAYIAFEVEHRIERYPFDATRFGPPSEAVALPKNGLVGNAGIEALAYLREGPARGALLAVSQDRQAGTGNHIGWLIGGPNPGALTVKDSGGFTVTDMTMLPGGDIAILERRLGLVEGMSMRIRRIAAESLKPGAVLDGGPLLEVTKRYNIDNMEAIAAHTAKDGQTILTVMSDNNFLGLQRSLILQFALEE